MQRRGRASGATLVFHVAAFAVCAYFLWRAEELFGSPHANTLAFGGRYAFLTQLTHTALTGYFAFLVGYDLYHITAAGTPSRALSPSIAPSPKTKRALRKAHTPVRTLRHRLNALNDYLFVLLFVFTSLVGLMFWGLFLYDPELILPLSVRHFYPQDLNYFQHGAVMLLMWLEAVVCRAHKNRSVIGELALVLAAGLLYLAWTFALVRLNGQWPYAFQKDMDLRGHAGFNLIGTAVIVLAFALARAVRSALRGHSSKAKAKAGAKVKSKAGRNKATTTANDKTKKRK